MRIGIDARSLSKKVCGVSQVVIQLIKALAVLDFENEYIIYVDKFFPDFVLPKNFRLVFTGCARKNNLQDFYFNRILTKDQLDVYHCMHSWLPLFLSRKTRVVITIHDLFVVDDLEFFAKYGFFKFFAREWFRYLLIYSVWRTDAIVAVSQYGKKEICRHFPEASNKVKVIPNASGLITQDFKGIVPLLEGKYFFYLGNCRSYKNVEMLIQGFARFFFLSNDQDIRLIIAGNDTYTKIIKLTESLGVAKNVKFVINPSSNKIIELYKGALAFVFPSKYEGFGIPVLEAMQFGVPVIISDAEALLEVAQGAALVVSHKQPDELAKAMQRIVNEKTLRHDLAEKGLDRVKIYTWERSAEELKSLYRATERGKPVR